eukprot:9374256-Pyramimonas_sp.AAC.1
MALGLQSLRAVRTGGKDAQPLETEVGMCWQKLSNEDSNDRPQRQGHKGTLEKARVLIRRVDCIALQPSTGQKAVWSNQPA